MPSPDPLARPITMVRRRPLRYLQDKREMYYNDTYAGQVYAMPCTADGTPDTSASWRTIVTLDADTQGSPDGMAIDSDHRLWVAHESGGQVTDCIQLSVMLVKLAMLCSPRF
jgi:sugar lactone lactonase YvrE